MAITDVYSKLEKYADTAIKIWDKSTDSNENWTNQKEREEFEKLNMKLIDLVGTLPAAEAKALPNPAGIESIKALKEQLYTDRHTPVTEINFAEPTNGGMSERQQDSFRPGQFKYAAAFGRTSDNGFKSFNEFAKSVRFGDMQRLRNSTGMSEGIGSNGGFLVPTEYSKIFIDKTFEQSVMLPGCTVFPMKSNILSVPAWANNDHTTSSFAGISTIWSGEGQAADYQIPKVRNMELTAKRLVILTSATQELSEDAPDFEGSLESGMASAASFELDDKLINGNGVGVPLGLMNSPALVTVAKTAGQTAGTISYDNVLNMSARIAPSCWNNSVFLAHPSCLPSLMKMYNVAGSGGTVVSVFVFGTGNGDTLLGRPLIWSEKCQEVGTSGDIILVDRSQYLVGMRKEVSLAVSEHVLFSSVEKAYRVVLRVDGQSGWAQPITPKHGVSTLSFATCIATRA